MSCVAHSLHLVVGGALLKKQGEQPSKTLYSVAQGEADFTKAIEQDFCERIDAFLYNVDCEKDCLYNVRNVVNAFRQLATYFKRSTKASNYVRDFYKQFGSPSKKKIKIDCATRWNSTLAMLERLLEFRPAIDGFFSFAATAQGKKDYNNLTVPRPTSLQWFILQCLTELLSPFQFASDAMGGNKYPTLLLVGPVLRTLEAQLSDDTIFDSIADSYRGEDFVASAICLMHAVRRAFLHLFKNRFKSLSEELAWLALLDPRLVDLCHFTICEKIAAKSKLLYEIESILSNENDDMNRSPHNVEMNFVDATPKRKRQKYMQLLFGARNAPRDESTMVENNSQHQRAQSELVLYFSDAKYALQSTNPLEWWRTNSIKYPLLSKVAQKWLGCIATSVPSKRAFSTSGNILCVRRCSLNADTVRDLVFVAANYNDKF